jgi:hypothetical protein
MSLLWKVSISPKDIAKWMRRPEDIQGSKQRLDDPLSDLVEYFPSPHPSKKLLHIIVQLPPATPPPNKFQIRK